ncbi:hypothetical protein BKA82DRAFT_7880 [Pisolithus tinctorius]|uniref:Uncharacterized protein n=1 Tax=Pisolithus tinctorius Marx 270 TaxID=870435 RepID=A0A0C3PLB6_PISTI|nr:hypothetical protein BKA82DRAFT_7880 [Pisolithus tinctorius]KIO09511.1 hypothetical protein M404DRAFT_7880 [Pisolithus tinctorius Marx 270]
MKRPGLSWLIISVPLPLADVPSSPELDTVIEIRINAGIRLPNGSATDLMSRQRETYSWQFLYLRYPRTVELVTYLNAHARRPGITSYWPILHGSGDGNCCHPILRKPALASKGVQTGG